MNTSLLKTLGSLTFTALILACLPGSAGAASALDDGIASYRRGNFAASAQTLQPLAQQGNATAKYLLSCQMINGIGIEADQKAGWTMLESAANSGNADAQILLARRMEALNAPHDDIRALYEQAATQNHSQALLWLALDEIAQDDRPAAKAHLQTAWHGGDPRAATLLATQFAAEIDNPDKLLQAAAQKGEMRAAAHLADRAQQAENYVKSVGWCAIASGLPGHAANVNWADIGVAIEKTCARYDEDLQPAARAQNRNNVDEFLAGFFREYEPWTPWRPCTVR
ncbi:sel1 repeat family protein [Thalassospira sp.]|uniref:sel1 repeat family protein n=1 Tax=Thalassospira sp. TaxID=1912094 RepID=UPI002735298A|nr:sel1 repeat family protein [Thalassospira sp.]MDP2696948.1 sel1 repeat family protein [Thalassospira sp.]